MMSHHQSFSKKIISQHSSHALTSLRPQTILFSHRNWVTIWFISLAHTDLSRAVSNRWLWGASLYTAQSPRGGANWSSFLLFRDNSENLNFISSSPGHLTSRELKVCFCDICKICFPYFLIKTQQ